MAAWLNSVREGFPDAWPSRLECKILAVLGRLGRQVRARIGRVLRSTTSRAKWHARPWRGQQQTQCGTTGKDWPPRREGRATIVVDTIVKDDLVKIFPW